MNGENDYDDEDEAESENENEIHPTENIIVNSAESNPTSPSDKVIFS